MNKFARINNISKLTQIYITYSRLNFVPIKKKTKKRNNNRFMTNEENTESLIIFKCDSKPHEPCIALKFVVYCWTQFSFKIVMNVSLFITRSNITNVIRLTISFNKNWNLILTLMYGWNLKYEHMYFISMSSISLSLDSQTPCLADINPDVSKQLLTRKSYRAYNTDEPHHSHVHFVWTFVSVST